MAYAATQLSLLDDAHHLAACRIDEMWTTARGTRHHFIFFKSVVVFDFFRNEPLGQKASFGATVDNRSHH